MTAFHTGSPARQGLAGILVVCAVGLAGSTRSARAWSETDIAPIAQITLEALVAARPTPGVTASITFLNGPHWSGGAGAADKEGTKPISAVDQMRIGSQTKTYTGTVVLQMIEEGKLGFDDTLSKVLPDSGVPDADKITVRNLLNMTSGIADYLRAPADALSGTCPQPPTDPATPPTVLDQWVKQSGVMTATATQLVKAASCLPSTGLGKMSYSNTNFVLLGRIIEKIAACGDTPPPSCYIDQLKSRVLDRMPGLTGTTFPDNADFPHPPFSGGYARKMSPGPAPDSMTSLANPDANVYVDFTRVTPPVPWTAGAMISSAEDEAIWITQLAGNSFKLLSDTMQRNRLTQVVRGDVAGIPAQYGLAIYYMRSPLNNTEMVGHSGSIVGYTSNVFRRTDNDTDYSANISTFLLTDQFSAPVVVWTLDRNVWGAISSTGNCGQGVAAKVPPGFACTGDSVRTMPLAVTRSLNLKPSGKSNDTYVPAAPDPKRPNSTPITTRKTPIPTVAFYGHKQSAVELTGSASLTIEPQAVLASVGNQSAAISLTGSQNSISVSGSVTANGRDVAALRDAGRGSTIAVSGEMSGSIVWWDPDLPFFGVPSVAMVAVKGDTSATVDLAGSNGRLAIDGLVQTQRIKTPAVQVQRAASNYTLSIGPKGAVIGPIVLAGNQTSLSIAKGGQGLYVVESRLLLPAPPSVVESVQAATTGRYLNRLAIAKQLPEAVTNDVYLTSGVPGIPPFLRPPATARSAATLSLESASPTLPPSMLALHGRNNTAKIDGTLVGSIPSTETCPCQSDYTKDVVAVEESGTNNTLTIGPTGIVIGDILLRGQGARMRLDGTAKGNVTAAGPSIVIEGSGRIEGTLTVNGTAVTQLGNLKFGPAQ
jgi:CubicO group peptidase (beta-lactamase class C family)